ncbi:hypothetical protein ACGCUQ_01810 [Eubacteriales bacterium KG127]
MLKKKIIKMYGAIVLTAAMTTSVMTGMAKVSFADTEAMNAIVEDVKTKTVRQEVQESMAKTYEEAVKNFEREKAETTAAKNEVNKYENNRKIAKEDLTAKLINADNLFANIVSEYSKLSEKAKAEVEDAETKAVKAKAELDEMKKDLESKKAEAAEVQKKIDGIKAQYPSIEEYAEKKAAIESLNKQIEAINATINDLNKQIEAKTNEMNTAQNAIDNFKQAVADQTKKVETAKNELNAAQKSFNDAEASVKNLTENEKRESTLLDEAAKSLETAKKNLANAQSELTQKEDLLKKSEARLAELGDAEETVKKMQKDVSDAEDRLNTAKQTLADAERKLEADELGVANAESNLKAEENKKAVLDKAVIEAEKVVKEKEEILNAANKVWEDKIQEAKQLMDKEAEPRKQAREFIDEIASVEKSIDVHIAELRKHGDEKIVYDSGYAMSEGKSYTINEILDSQRFKEGIEYATSTKNLLRAMDAIDKLNEIRKSENLNSDIKVSANLMAKAIVASVFNGYECDHTMGRYDSLLPSGENLAWGYEDPYKGLYTDEKRVAEYAKEHNLIANESNPEDQAKIAKALGLPGPAWAITGHYEAIICEDMRTVGMAFAPHYMYIPGDKKFHLHKFDAIAQEFGSDFTSSINIGKTYTTEEFRKALEEYTKRPTPEFIAAKAAYEKIKAEKPEDVIKAERALDESKLLETDANEKANAQNVVFEGKKADLNKAIATRDAQKLTIVNDKKVIETEKAAVKAAEKTLADFLAINDIEAEKVKLNKTVKDTTARIAELKSNIKTYTSDQKSAEESIAVISPRVEKAKKDLEAAKTNMSEEKEKLDEAKTTLDAAEKTLAQIKSGEESNKAIVKAAKAKLDELNAAKAKSDKELEALKVKLNAIKLPAGVTDEIYKAFNTDVNKLVGINKSVDSLTKSVANKTNEVAELDKALVAAKSALIKAEAKLAAAKKVDREVPETFEEFVELVNAEADVEKAKEALAAAEAGYENATKNLKQQEIELALAEAEFKKFEAEKLAREAKEREEAIRIADLKEKNKLLGKKNVSTGDSSNIFTAIYLIISSLTGISLFRRKIRK